MTRILVVSTAARAGKTTLARALLRLGLTAGLKVRALKPMDVGCPYAKDHDIQSKDARLLLEAAGTHGLGVGDVTPYRMHQDAPPSSFGEITGVEIAFTDLASMADEAERSSDLLVIEGLGAMSTPLVGEQDVLDLATDTTHVALVVVDDRDGPSQARLAAHTLATRGLQPSLVLLNRPAPFEQPSWTRLTLRLLSESFGDERVVGPNPHESSGEQLRSSLRHHTELLYVPTARTAAPRA